METPYSFLFDAPLALTPSKERGKSFSKRGFAPLGHQIIKRNFKLLLEGERHYFETL
jgi:hypothetical protein|tara:strand:+ start:3644 stop:3814 length:171 start_codon:yes stop_codon:yes gene_type:complete